MTARKPLPAIYWSDKVVWANRCLAQSRSFLLAVTDAVTDPADPWAIELRNARRDAAKADVEAWKAYIRRAEEAFADAAEHEMTEADEKERAAAHYAEQARLAAEIDRQPTFGGRPYDVPRCAHGCCPDAVCAFVDDCLTHQGGAA